MTIARALDFPLGRPVVPAAQIRRRRGLPPTARPLVRDGDQVRAEQAIAEATGPTGAFSVLAGMPGTIAEVGQDVISIDGQVAILQGVIGVGAVAVGPLALVPTSESPAVVHIPPGAILVYPQRVPLTLLQRALAGGAVGVIAGSAAALELEGFARMDLSAVMDGLAGDATHVPLTILLTEGLGDLPMQPALQAMVSARAGSTVLVDGATNPRHNVRPEVLLPAVPAASVVSLPADSVLISGARVRIAAGHYRGAVGVIAHLFAFPQPAETGQLLPSAQVRLEQGNTLVVPLALLDRLA
jgi:hypothetical protein